MAARYASVRAGFRLVEAGAIILGSHELFHREQSPVGCLGLGGLGGMFVDLREPQRETHIAWRGLHEFRKDTQRRVEICGDGPGAETRSVRGPRRSLDRQGYAAGTYLTENTDRRKPQ